MSPPPAESSDAGPAQLLADPGRAAEAFDRLYDRHAADLLAFARSRFPHIAEDLCQTAWAAAIQHQWKPGDHVRAWLFRVVANRGVSDLRRNRRAAAGLPDDAADPDAGPADRLLDRERADRARRCGDELRARKPEWWAVVQAFLDGERPEDAARRLGITRANFDQRKKRALDALGRCIDPEKGAAP